MSDQPDNGVLLRQAIETAGLTQASALEMFNQGRDKPMSVSQWKAYLASTDSKRKYKCPDWVLDKMIRIAGDYKMAKKAGDKKAADKQ